MNDRPPGPEHREAVPRAEGEEAIEHVAGIARPEDLGHRIVPAEILHAGIEKWKEGDRDRHVKHGPKHRLPAQRAR